jgi:hypothetical protein
MIFFRRKLDTQKNAFMQERGYAIRSTIDRNRTPARSSRSATLAQPWIQERGCRTRGDHTMSSCWDVMEGGPRNEGGGGSTGDAVGMW